MIAPFLERHIGANWRTSLSGLLTTVLAIAVALAALPEETWHDWRVSVPAVLGIIAKTIKDFSTKDARVTGGSVVQNPPGFRHAGKSEDFLP